MHRRVDHFEVGRRELVQTLAGQPVEADKAVDLVAVALARLQALGCGWGDIGQPVVELFDQTRLETSSRLAGVAFAQGFAELADAFGFGLAIGRFEDCVAAAFVACNVVGLTISILAEPRFETFLVAPLGPGF